MPLLMLQRLEAQTVRGCGSFTETLLLVGFVLLVVSREEHHLGVTLKSEDMGGNTVEEPTVMRRYHRAARELKQCILKRAERFNVEVIRRLVKEQHVAACEQRLREMETAALTAGKITDALLLILALEVEAADV